MSGTGKRKLFIGGLPSECEEKALASAFSHWEVECVEIIYDRETRKSRHFGYVTFKDAKAASDAMKQMGGESGKGKEIFQRNISIEYAQDNDSPSARSRGQPERDDPYNGNGRYGRPPPDRRPQPPGRSGYPPQKDYDRGYKRERPPSYGSKRGYGDKYPPPERRYSISERSYGPPGGERYDSAARGYGSERAYYDRYSISKRYPPTDRSYGSERGYDRSSYGASSDRGYGASSNRGYGASSNRGYGRSYDRSSYGWPPSKRRHTGAGRPGFASGSGYCAGGLCTWEWTRTSVHTQLNFTFNCTGSPRW